MVNMKGYREKLLRTFWGAAGRAGVREDDAYAFAKAIYPRKRLSTMTTDELEHVVRLFIKKTGSAYRMPVKIENKNKRKIKSYKGIEPRYDLEPATSGQIELIENYANVLGLEDFHIEALMYRAGARIGEPLSVQVARNMIEGMKKMLGRGWKPKVTKEIDYENVTWN